MLRNYWKIAWRNLTRNRVYSIVNILGLALGMAVVLLIGAWIHDELRFNTGFPQHDRIMAVMQHSTHGGRKDTWRACPIPLAAELRDHYGSEFDNVVLSSFFDMHSLQTGNSDPISQGGIYAQAGFPALLGLHIIGGQSQLNGPASMLVSRSAARALFGGEDVVGRTVKLDNKASLKITGVYEDLPQNSDWKGLDVVMSWEYYEGSFSFVKENEHEWNANSFQILAKLRPAADVTKVNERIKGALDGHDRKDKPVVFLHPMDRWHLYSDFKDGKNTGGGIQYVWMFGSIGVFILLLACINFMNLSTARSERRAREVGIRKSIGSMRRQLIIQFLGESVLMAALAALLALLLAELSLPWFSELAGMPIHLDLSGRFLVLLAGFTGIVGLLAGSYPALYLSGFNAVSVLKGQFRGGGALPRKVLTVLQFTVSITLIIGTIVVFSQIVYVKDRPVGYERQGLLFVRIGTNDLFRNFDPLRNELLQSGAVSDVTLASTNTTGGNWQQSGFSWAGKDPNIKPLFDVVFTNFDYGRTIGWQVMQGRDFSRDFPTDSAAMILNEAAVSYMGLKKPVGATVNYLYSDRADNRYHIIGVIRDIVVGAPEEKVSPAIYMMAPGNSSWIMVRVNPRMNQAEAIAPITKVFRKYNPGAPFDFQYSADQYAMKFSSEDRVLRLAVFFTAFAIFISCLGLFGLASFMAEQRVREIGVRKVLGASVIQLCGLLSRDFLRLVSIAWLISVPVAWFAMNRWLQGYDYRTTISWWIFLFTLPGALLITLLTVSVQSIRASMASPVNSLRSE
ncbi:MAG: ABC transporter permease [Bacteroidetes bacterium]|nr:ABC transporter permease [Bacteroidota bacterium]